MARSHYTTMIAAGAAVLASIGAAVSAAAHAVVAFAREMVHWAFPATVPRELQPLAAPPRVTGLHQARAFRMRLFDHQPDGHRRAPLSGAFAAAA